MSEALSQISSRRLERDSVGMIQVDEREIIAQVYRSVEDRRKLKEEELAYRKNNGVEAQLVWQRDEDVLALKVHDEATGEKFVLNPPRDKGLDAFEHPYAYATAA